MHPVLPERSICDAALGCTNGDEKMPTFLALQSSTPEYHLKLFTSHWGQMADLRQLRPRTFCTAPLRCQTVTFLRLQPRRLFFHAVAKLKDSVLDSVCFTLGQSCVFRMARRCAINAAETEEVLLCGRLEKCIHEVDLTVPKAFFLGSKAPLLEKLCIFWSLHCCFTRCLSSLHCKRQL